MFINLNAKTQIFAQKTVWGHILLVHLKGCENSKVPKKKPLRYHGTVVPTIRSFSQLSSTSFQLSGSNQLFPYSNGKSRIDGLMTKRQIDGPFRCIIFHPFLAIGGQSVIWRSIERAISIADGFQSYQSWCTIGPKKMKIIILTFFHWRPPAIHRIDQLMTKRRLIDEKMEIDVRKKCVRDNIFIWNSMLSTHQ